MPKPNEPKLHKYEDPLIYPHTKSYDFVQIYYYSDPLPTSIYSSSSSLTQVYHTKYHQEHLPTHFLALSYQAI